MTIRFTAQRAWTQSDAVYAAARVGHVPRGDVNALYTAATNAGFRHIGNNAYQHDDRSWIQMRADGAIDRGVGVIALTGMPPAAQVQVSVSVGWGQTQYDTTSRPPLPSNTWQWWRDNTALGQLPRINSATAASTLPSYGFTQSNGAWVHPDGSWAKADAYGSISVGWKGYTLGELPYNERFS